MMKVFALALMVGVAAAAAYPTTYPYENENFVPPNIAVVPEPNLTYDPETDTGGYVYYYAVKLGRFDGAVQDSDMPYCDQKNGFCQYALVNTFFCPPEFPIQIWNCTTRNYIFDSADFSGMANGQKVCEVGACCSQYYGQVKFSDDQMDWHSWLDDRNSAALCGDIAVEDNYCIWVGGDFQMNCIDYHLSALERLVVTACYDSFVRFYFDCTVFLSVYTPATIKEPPAFQDGMSNEETIIHDSISFLQDRICFPYSYYYPSESGGGNTGGGNTGGDSPASEDSPAAAFTVAAVAFAALLL